MRLLDPLEQRPEDPGLGHAGLVDDEQAALGQFGLEEPVEGCRGNAGLVLELLGGDAGRGAAEYRHAGRPEGVGEGAGGGRLAGAREPDDADDPVGAGGDGFEHRPLLGRERRLVRSSASAETAGAPAAEPRSTSASDASLERQSARLWSSARAGPAVPASPTGSTPSARARRAASGSDPLGRSSLGVCLRPGHDEVGIGEGGRLLGQSARTEHPCGELEQVAAARAPVRSCGGGER